jgi:hypothetical protein
MCAVPIVGNTCAPCALITGQESLYCTEELQATSYGDIDETTEGSAQNGSSPTWMPVTERGASP